MSPKQDRPSGGIVRPTESVVVITGNYGSGKSEVAVNWALALARAGEDVAIADLDVVNPYFRCREASELMRSAGIRVIAPEGEMHHAELPIILPEIRGAIEAPRGLTLLDVGGDEDGARVLSSLAGSFRRYEMLQVVNQRRPFTDTVEGCLRIQSEIEAASRLRVTGLVSNAHLMDESDEAVVAEGARFAREVGERNGRPLRFVAAERRLSDRLDEHALGCPILLLDRLLLPPWRRPDGLGSQRFKIQV